MTDGVAQWLPNGIVFRPDTTFDEWQEQWGRIDATDKALQWIIGDTLVWGEARFESWSQVVDQKYAEKYRAKMWLSKAIPQEQRRDGFSYSFHRELGGIDRAERDTWFDQAITEGWNTVERLKKERGKQPRRPYPSNSGPPGDDAPPASEDDYGTINGSAVVGPLRNSDESALDIETIRRVIESVRAYGSAPLDSAPIGAREITASILAMFLGAPPLAPLRLSDDAIALKPEGWRLTLMERDNGAWECRLRSNDAQRQAIGLSPRLQCAVIEACLAARITDFAE